MAGNPTPDNQDVLLALAEDLADGVHENGAAIGIAQNTEAKIRADIATLRAKENAFATTKAAEATAAKGVSTADKALKEFLKDAAGYLRRKLGTRWNMQWEPTGFPTGSTAVPTDQDVRHSVTGKLKDYFTANPAMEVDTPNLVVTAARAESVFEALSDARDAETTASTNRDAAGTQRDAALAALRKRVSGTISEIGDLIGPDDSRWPSFGLSKPSDPDLPEPVTQITLTPAGPGAINGSFKRSRRGDRWRIFAKILTVDTDPQQVALVHDLSFQLTGLPSGKTVEITIIAANDSGESAPSDAVTAVVG